MSLTRDDVVHVAQLARIALSDAEIDTYRSQLASILASFDALASVDTDDVPATAQVVPVGSAWRDDEVRPSLAPEAALANAPRVMDGFIRVRAVLD